MKKKRFGPNSAITELPGKWSGRAKKVMAAVTDGPSILEFYYWHWSHGGKNKYRGFSSYELTGVALKTYEEIRRRLMRNGFPDLSDSMFSISDFSIESCPKSLLKKVLAKWKTSLKEKRVALREEMLKCGYDGH